MLRLGVPAESARQDGAATDDRAAFPRAREWVLLALAGGSAYLLLRTLWPFMPAIVTSAVLAVLVHPAYRFLARRTERPSLGAFITTVIVFFLGLLPAVGLALLLLDQVRVGIGWISRGATDALAPAGSLAEGFERLVERFGLDSAGVGDALSAQAQALVSTLADRTLGLFTGLGGWLLQAGIALFTLYYLLRDGERLVRHLKWLIPLEPALSDRLFVQARDVTFATIYGSVVVALVQGTIGGLAFWAVGLPSPVVWGTLMGGLSLLPVVGAFFIWLPAGVLLILGGEIARGIVLLAVGGLIISTIDNVLRALLVGGRAQLHPLIVFFSVLGGLFVFGAVGVVVGPVLFVIALTLVEMARLSLGPAEAEAEGPA